MEKKIRDKKYTISDDIAKQLGLNIIKSKLYRLTPSETLKYNQIKANSFTSETTTETNQYDSPKLIMSALKSDGKIMTIDEWCEHYGIPPEHAKSYKLVTHGGKGAYYNLASTNLNEDDFIDFDFIRERVQKDLESINYTPKNIKSDGKIIVASIADLHFGAYIDNLVKTKPFSIGLLAELLQESANIINEYNAKEVHVRVLGDLIESFTGMNHKNSWKGLQKGMIGAEVVKLATKVVSDNFLSRINNLKNVGIIAGNHDRVTSAKDEDIDGDAANLISWGLELIGYDVEFNPFILSTEIDGINYINLHGHDFISKKSTKDICWDYGKQGMFNFIMEGHLHSIIEKLSATQVNKFQTIKDDAVDHRRMNIPSFFTGNSFSERLGFTSNSGFIVSYNNGKGIPNVDFKAL